MIIYVYIGVPEIHPTLLVSDSWTLQAQQFCDTWDQTETHVYVPNRWFHFVLSKFWFKVGLVSGATLERRWTPCLIVCLRLVYHPTTHSPTHQPPITNPTNPTEWSERQNVLLVVLPTSLEQRMWIPLPWNWSHGYRQCWIVRQSRFYQFLEPKKVGSKFDAP